MSARSIPSARAGLAWPMLLAALAACAQSPAAAPAATPQAVVVAPAASAPAVPPIIVTRMGDATPVDTAMLLAASRKYTEWFYTSRTDSLLAYHVPAARPASGTFYTDRLAQLTANAGSEQQLLDEKFIRRNGGRQYWRTARFSNIQEPIVLRWVIVDDGRIAGFGMNPQSQNPPTDP